VEQREDVVLRTTAVTAARTAEGLSHYDIRAKIHFPHCENRRNAEDHPVPAVPGRRWKE